MPGKNYSRYFRKYLISSLFLALCLLLGHLTFSYGLANSLSSEGIDDVDAALTNADKAIEAAKESTGKVNEAKTKIIEANKSSKADLSTAQVFSDLTKYLKENIGKVLENQKDEIKGLKDQKQALEKLRKSIEAITPKPEGSDDAIAKLKKKESEVEAQSKASNEASSALETEAKKAYTTVEAMTKELGTRVALLADDKLAKDAKADALLVALPTQLPILAKTIELKKDLDKNFPPLKTELTKIAADPNPDSLAKAFADAKSAIEVPFNKLPTWLDTIKTKAEATNKALVEQRLKLDKDLQKNAVEAIKLLDEAEQEEKLLSDFLAAWAVLVPQIKDRADFQALKNLVEKIEAALKIRPDRTQLVRGALAGNFEKFEPDFVQLYFFTDAFSLMKALNPNVKQIKDVSALREEATRQRRALDEASLAQVSAQATVSELQTRVRDLENALRDAQANALASARDLVLGTRRLDELKSRPDPDPGKIRAAEQRKADLETQDKANQDTLTKLSDEKAGLPAKIAEARQNLLTAQKAVTDRRIAMVSLAQIESDAFANARDNEPVFYTDINVTDKDPLKQIQIYAFGSRKVIYLRGIRENVDKAKEIISLFDRPAPQARLNLWTLELNSTEGMSGAKKFNKALSRVENELSNTRAKITAALSYLRDCINEEVNAIAIEKLRELEAARRNNGDGPNNNQNYLAPQDAEDLRWARMYFYQKEVLMRLGFDPEKTVYESRRQSNTVNFRALPDPAGTTTLGEALVILSLANAGSRHEVMKKFSAGVRGKLVAMGLYAARTDNICPDQPSSPIWFASTIRALGADDQPYYKYQQVTDNQLRRGGRPDSTATPLPVAAPRFFPHDYAFTAMQERVVEAISMAQIPRLIRRLRQLQQRLSVATSQAQRDNINDEARAILSWLHFTLGVDVNSILTQGLVTEIEALAKKNNVLRTANAKVASTDLMLRQMINEVDSDISLHFVQPMVDCLRSRLISEHGISVGIVNHTSVLATNRLVARVNARSSAQLSIGEEQDILAGVQQLASLALSAQTGSFLGGLNALGGLPQKQTSEIYGINNGSLFKVTPIFDPTGQALRFQFDYVLANLVQDPNGSINPQLPRIERHTVNTEVELNNMELREISRFSSNSRLGIATTTKGGIPIIKDIPGMKYVPLLGWFVRRAGKSAVIQQSLMFGQTTMHPTIADIFDLLSGEDYNLDDPKCLCPEDAVQPPADLGAQKSQEQQPQEQQRTTPAVDEVKRLQSRIGELENEVKKLQDEANKLSNEVKRLQSRVGELEDEVEKLQSEASKNEKERRQKDARIAELTSLIRVFRRWVDDTRVLESQISALENEVKRLQSITIKDESDKKKEGERIAELITDIKALGDSLNEVRRLQVQIAALKNEVQKLEGETSRNENERKEKAERIAKVNREIQELELKIEKVMRSPRTRGLSNPGLDLELAPSVPIPKSPPERRKKK